MEWHKQEEKIGELVTFSKYYSSASSFMFLGSVLALGGREGTLGKEKVTMAGANQSLGGKTVDEFTADFL